MRNKIMHFGAAAMLTATTATTAANAGPTTLAARTSGGRPAPKKLYFDMHDVGKGTIKAKDVAEAHKKDLATQGQYGVDFKAYWVAEKAGKIFCLAEAPSAEMANTVHKEAHGLVADQILEVTADTMDWKPTPGMKLFMDVHHLGAGKVTPEDVAGAHKKDIEVGAKYKVRFLNYWLDAASGTVMCLSEAPSAEAAIATHKEAHGLLPDSIEEVTEGR
jgi:hypothetical protein